MSQPSIDILSIVHFLQYFILGLFYKKRYKLILLTSIVWEIFEYFIAKNPYTKTLLIQYWPIPQRYWDERNIKNKYFDILINILGYYIGNKVSTSVIVG